MVNDTRCMIEGCGGSYYVRGLCQNHYYKAYRAGTIEVHPRKVTKNDPCAIDGCENLTLARGWCSKHYARWKAHGDPEKVLPRTGGPKVQDPAKLFWAKVDADGDCWEWMGARNPKGYGIFGTKGKNVYAHRFAWEILVGPIPDGLIIDHRCKNTPCVNPDHLEPVTYSENITRGAGPYLTTIRRAVTHCKHNHEFTDENTYTYVWNGKVKRACIQCKKDRGQTKRG